MTDVTLHELTGERVERLHPRSNAGGAQAVGVDIASRVRVREQQDFLALADVGCEADARRDGLVGLAAAGCRLDDDHWLVAVDALARRLKLAVRHRLRPGLAGSGSRGQSASQKCWRSAAIAAGR